MADPAELILEFREAVEFARTCDGSHHEGAEQDVAAAEAALLAALAKTAPEGWRDISTAPTEGHVLLGGYVVPSAAAQANGSKIVWHYGIGTALWDGQWSGFLGSRPTHWMPLPAAPKVPTS